MLTHGAMWGCELTSLVVCINDKFCDIRERNVTIRNEIWTTNICSLGFPDIRRCVTLWRLILRSLGCMSLLILGWGIPWSLCSWMNKQMNAHCLIMLWSFGVHDFYFKFWREEHWLQRKEWRNYIWIIIHIFIQSHSYKSWQSYPIIMIFIDTYGYFIHQNHKIITIYIVIRSTNHRCMVGLKTTVWSCGML